MTDFDSERITIRNPGRELIRQFVIHAENKVGWLNDMVSKLNGADVHVMAISVLDTTDSALVRMVTNYPDETSEILLRLGINHSERKIVAVEMPNESSLKHVTSALLQAEINIHYVYPFLTWPNDRPVLAIGLEDEDIAIDVLTRNNLRVLSQEDLAR
ncbi:MAG: hypothetical protein HOA16_14840 [Opitutae bacterium]|jgi:hypothetical protein|nr:hypothetical protein [Opitutae bacterium]